MSCHVTVPINLIKQINNMIKNKELKKLQKLAKINFTSEELNSFSVKLGNVIKMIDELHKVDCSSIEPLRSVCNMDQRVRQDKVEVTDLSADLFKNIPKQGANFAKGVKYFVVPKVIK